MLHPSITPSGVEDPLTPILIVEEHKYTEYEQRKALAVGKYHIAIYYIVVVFALMFTCLAASFAFMAGSSAINARTNAGQIGLWIVSGCCVIGTILLLRGLEHCVRETIEETRVKNASLPRSMRFVYHNDVLIKELHACCGGKWVSAREEMLHRPHTALGLALNYVVEAYVDEAWHLRYPFQLSTTDAHRKQTARKQIHALAHAAELELDNLWKIHDRRTDIHEIEDKIESTEPERTKSRLFEVALNHATDTVNH